MERPRGGRSGERQKERISRYNTIYRTISLVMETLTLSSSRQWRRSLLIALVPSLPLPAVPPAFPRSPISSNHRKIKFPKPTLRHHLHRRPGIRRGDDLILILGLSPILLFLHLLPRVTGGHVDIYLGIDLTGTGFWAQTAQFVKIFLTDKEIHRLHNGVCIYLFENPW